MKLVDDWSLWIKHLWSVRLALASAGAQALVFVVPMVQPAHPSAVFIIVSGMLQVAAALLALAAAGATVVKQPAAKAKVAAEVEARPALAGEDSVWL